MKITESIHAIRHPFRLALGNGQYVDRFVYSYLIVGKTICLIDTGVSATAPLIVDYVRGLGRKPEEIALILLTHAHPDHIGGCASIKKDGPGPHRRSPRRETLGRGHPKTVSGKTDSQSVRTGSGGCEGGSGAGRRGNDSPGRRKNGQGHRNAGPFPRICRVFPRRGGGPFLRGCRPLAGSDPDLCRSLGIDSIRSETQTALRRQMPFIFLGYAGDRRPDTGCDGRGVRVHRKDRRYRPGDPWKGTALVSRGIEPARPGTARDQGPPGAVHGRSDVQGASGSCCLIEKCYRRGRDFR